MEDINQKIRYEQAKKEVEKIKGFYIHALVFVLINGFLLFNKYDKLPVEVSFLELKNFKLVFFWGIGLAAHGISVFGPSLMFGKNWEERKIRELMNRDKNQKWE